MQYNYQTVCHSQLLKDLPDKHKEVIARRFGLRASGGEPRQGRGGRETLEQIGQDFGITRERVRQIEEDGLRRLNDKISLPICQNIFQDFYKYFKKSGFLKREDLLLADLGGGKYNNYVFLFLSLGNNFQKYRETEDFHAFWIADRNIFNTAQKIINNFASQLENKKEPMSLPREVPLSYVEISKNILKSHSGLYGLKDWPEINPRGVKDKAYLVMKQEKKPLHFDEVTRLIGKGSLVQTVHNELIKDSRFVLVGRGLYALKEWGYEPGIVKDVIARTIANAGSPLSKEAIVEEVLKQRYVQPNTVLLNLQNQKYFIKNSEGRYAIRKS